MAFESKPGFCSAWRTAGSESRISGETMGPTRSRRLTERSTPSGPRTTCRRRTNATPAMRGRSSYVLGFSAVQLAEPTEPDSLNLDELVRLGLVSDVPAVTPRVPGNETEQAALGYLHANCSHCHNASRPNRVAHAASTPRATSTSCCARTRGRLPPKRARTARQRRSASSRAARREQPDRPRQ